MTIKNALIRNGNSRGQITCKLSKSRISEKLYHIWQSKERQDSRMSKNEIIGTALTAQYKLELIKTLISHLINMVEDVGEIKTTEQAMNFACNQNVIDDFLQIAHDGVYFAIQTLDGLQKGGADNE